MINKYCGLDYSDVAMNIVCAQSRFCALWNSLYNLVYAIVDLAESGLSVSHLPPKGGIMGALRPRPFCILHWRF